MFYFVMCLKQNYIFSKSFNATQKIKSAFCLVTTKYFRMNQLNLFPEAETKKEKETTNTTATNRIDIYRRVYKEITWQQLVKKLLIALKVPFIAAKHHIITNVKSGVKNYLNTHPFPWFRLALVLLFLYAFFQKDLQFNINLGGANTLSEEKINPSSKLMVSGIPRVVKHTAPENITLNLNDKSVEAYINRFKRVAIVEMDKFDIPASIKMGQALLASHAGTNSLAKQYNNHFAITCIDGADCESFQVGNQSAMIKKYGSAWESWRNHSQLLSTPKYTTLKNYKKNYKKWASGLEAAGFSQTNNYGEQLIQVIEKYQLYQLDHLTRN